MRASPRPREAFSIATARARHAQAFGNLPEAVAIHSGRAGTPPTTAPGATSSQTAAPTPTTAPAPIVT